MAESCVEAIERNVTHCLRGKQWLPAVQTARGYLARVETGEEVASVVDEALERLAPIKGWTTTAFGAKVRIWLQASAFRALRGELRAVNRVMPNRDACWVSRVSEAVGHRGTSVEDGAEVLAGVRAPDVERLFSAWSALDWDGTLGIETIFGRERKRPLIAKRKWAELSQIVATSTSFDRLILGEREGTVTALFAHPDATIDDKLGLALQLAARGRGSAWMSDDGIALVVRVLSPHLAAANCPMPAALRRIASRVASE